MSNVVDTPARVAAVDPVISVCVSAPAGSGKTELLIQRYLGLLSRVQRPEQILAITFTRKAAAEMRERVLQALHNAQANAPCDSPHQTVTRALAQQALAADARGGWQLLRNMSRCNIKTIDSFCAGLTRQMPVLSQFGGPISVRDDATPLYAEAVQALYQLLDGDHPVAADLAALLLHFDNNWESLQTLLVAMLARRDQWRDYVGVHRAPRESEAYLVASIEALVSGELRQLARLLTPHELELLELQQYAASNLQVTVPTRFPGAMPRDLQGWHSLRAMLLTAKGEWRKTITQREGFPSAKGAAQQRKAQWKELLSQLQAIHGLQDKLAAIQTLPVIEDDSVSWQLVLHLSRLLPTLAAQLLLVFQQHGVVDHSQVAQSALLALGDDDAPTELALRMDYRIEHILVDEFQDTAITQYELLHKLTRGWGEHNALNPEAPRTLMIVGDAMQSIYGFRGANVGLFLKARREGFNGIVPRYLQLHCNFRSDKGVVDWINDTFSHAFPTRDDVYRSQVSYSPATAVRPARQEPAVAMHAFHGAEARRQEVAFICDHIARCSSDASATTAILGRSRSHLQPIIRRLKQLRIAYHAPDLDALAQSPVVADLLTLCRALNSDADRLAWMALLRAPWCGLGLGDLLCVARFGDTPIDTPVWVVVQHPALQQSLSEDGRLRIAHIIPALHTARVKRDRLSLRVWVEQAWLALDGPQCAPDTDSLLDAEHFFQLLEQAEIEGVGLDIEWLTLGLQKSFTHAGDPDCKLHLLTLHKAKGLEFDTVIIPQLDRLPRGDGRDILLWDEHSSADGARSFFLAADDHSAADAPTLYNYLRLQRRQKALLEATRLLYVGATRAIRHLLLTAAIRVDAKTAMPEDPGGPSLLSRIWHTFRQQMTVHHAPSLPPPTRTDATPRRVTRLVRDTAPEGHAVLQRLSAAGYDCAPRPAHRRDRSTGNVVHQALEELSRCAPLPAAASEADRQRWRRALQREGLQGATLDAAYRSVLVSIEQSLRAGGSGRWLLSSEHSQARSEWSLTSVDPQGRIRDIVIDRSFIDAATGVRWIIDYKTTSPAQGESLDAFTQRESAIYCEQLRSYRDAVRSLGNEPLRCALFFTALGHLHVLKALDLPGLDTGATPWDD